MKSPTLFATRGLPGCGKSTWAVQFAAAERDAGNITSVLSRDDWRDQLGVNYHGDAEGERRVQQAHVATIRELLESGYAVVTDDTNLRLEHLEVYAVLAIQTGAAFTVVDFINTPVELCVERNAQRPARQPGACAGAAVPEDAIRSLHAAYIRGRDLPLPVPETATLTYAPGYGPVMAGGTR